MHKFPQYFLRFFRKKPTKNVALVLGGGGARGFAQIGAIEALEAHGYKITSISGTSIGALVGGLYACGKMEEAKKIILQLNRRKVLSLMDISPGLNHLATADKLTELLSKLTNNADIETLPIPFCCVASDLASEREYVFDKGPLAKAIRSSISIPGIFSPVHIGNHVLVDGSVHNTLPLNRIKRHKGDILVAVNASAADDPELYNTDKKNKDENALWRRIFGKLPVMKSKKSDNFLSIALRVCQISVLNNTLTSIAMNPPDICFDIPMNSYALLDFDKGKDIIEYGRKKMEEILSEWEKERGCIKHPCPFTALRT